MRRNALFQTATLVVLATAACSSGSTDPNGTGHLTFQLATLGTGASTSPTASSAVSISRGNDVIDITSVQLVARRIKLERVNGTCPAADLSDAGAADTGETPECPNLQLGPLLLEPPVGDGAQSTFNLDLAPGTYDKIQLQIHRPTNHTSDAAFLSTNPGFLGVSIKATGTFNGTPFTFTTDITNEIAITLDTPVEVAAAGSTSLTLLLDVRGWFLDGTGQGLLTPLTLNQQARQLVEQNIRGSFHAFEDADHDGQED